MHKKEKRHKKTFGSDRYVYYLDYGDGIMACVQMANSYIKRYSTSLIIWELPTHLIVYIKYAVFVYCLYLNNCKVEKK